MNEGLTRRSTRRVLVVVAVWPESRLGLTRGRKRFQVVMILHESVDSADESGDGSCVPPHRGRRKLVKDPQERSERDEKSGMRSSEGGWKPYGSRRGQGCS